MTTILRFAPISEGKTWRPRSATSDLRFRVDPQVASLRTSPSRVEPTASLALPVASAARLANLARSRARFAVLGETGAQKRGRSAEMKKVVSGGPVRAITCPQADAGLPDTTFFISRTFSRPIAAPAFRPSIPSSARGIDSGPRRFTEIVLNMTNMNGSRTIAGLRSDAGRRAPSAAHFIQGLGVIVGRVGIPGLTPPGYEPAPLTGLGKARQRKRDERKLDARPTLVQPSLALPRTLSSFRLRC